MTADNKRMLGATALGVIALVIGAPIVALFAGFVYLITGSVAWTVVVVVLLVMMVIGGGYEKLTDRAAMHNLANLKKF